MEEEHLEPIAEISRRCFSKIYVFDWYENAGNMLKLFKQGKVVVRVIKRGRWSSALAIYVPGPAGAGLI